MNKLETGAFGFGIIGLIIIAIIIIISELYFTAFFVTSVLGVEWWSINFYLTAIGLMAILGSLNIRIMGKNN